MPKVNLNCTDHRALAGLMLTEFYFMASMLIAFSPLPHSGDIATVSQAGGILMAVRWWRSRRPGRPFFKTNLPEVLQRVFFFSVMAGTGAQFAAIFMRQAPILGLGLTLGSFVVIEACCFFQFFPMGRQIDPDSLEYGVEQ
ncbi:MAG TPA: hypothetical protein VFA48_08820 [Gammaproteobacteria bacterium]|nr:hypothetical protein [Gammaproteobacteria bacterium]